ncbi:Npt1/Npt2 family nucleotide transporter [candidate division KSB1 bacterium]
MQQFFGKILNIRKDELAITLLMCLYYYLILVTYYFLKPARDSLFLVKLGSSQLPVVFILIALIVVPITTLYSKAGRSFKLTTLINATTVILISNLFILRWLVELGGSWVYYTFYVWVSIYGILATSQFWLFANAVYNPVQAKRIFVLLALGGIIGAFTGGEVTGFAVQKLGVATENLLFFCTGFLTICIFLLNIIWKLKKKKGEDIKVPVRKEEERKESMGQVFGTIFRSRHLLLIVGIIAMTMMAASFVDYQFKTVSVNAFPEKSDLTSFFGKFYGRLSLISLFFQLILSYRFLRVLGVGGAILFLPAGLLLGSLFMFIAPGLLAGVLLRGADGSFKYSIDKTGRELLFLPVSLEAKKRTKIFIDVFVDRWFRGIAGGLLLLFTLVFHFSVRQISLVVLVLLVIWFIIALLMKKEYVNAFRIAIEKREIDPAKLRINMNEASTISMLKASLNSNNERQVVYALDMLSSITGINLTEDVKPLLQHRVSEIRRRAIQIFQSQEQEEFIKEIEEMVNDPDPEVRLNAMHYLCKHSEDDSEKLLKNFLESQDQRILSTAVVCIAEYGTSESKNLLDEQVFEKLLTIEGKARDNSRIHLAKALGALNNPKFRSYLMSLMKDPSIFVSQQAIRSSGRTRDRELVHVLIKKLADKKYRMDARKALVEYGYRVLGTLKDYLTDDTVDFTIRKNIPGVLKEIPTQESVDILTDSLISTNPSLKYFILKSLNKLCSTYEELQFDHQKIDSVIINETKSYYEILHILKFRKENEEKPAGKLLRRALKEKLDRNLESIFRMLGLRYSAKDIFNSYQGIISNKEVLRANAVEFLDNLLSSEIKKYLLPILDQDSPQAVIQHGQRLFNIRIETYEKALKNLARGSDSWLKACAIYVIFEENNKDLIYIVKDVLHDSDSVVRETAELITERIKTNKF